MGEGAGRLWILEGLDQIAGSEEGGVGSGGFGHVTFHGENFDRVGRSDPTGLGDIVLLVAVVMFAYHPAAPCVAQLPRWLGFSWAMALVPRGVRGVRL
jgi:hypothetical protein